MLNKLAQMAIIFMQMWCIRIFPREGDGETDNSPEEQTLRYRFTGSENPRASTLETMPFVCGWFNSENPTTLYGPRKLHALRMLISERSSNLLC